MSSYEGSKDPLEHFENFKVWMDLYVYSDVVKYQSLQLTLTEEAWAWYCTLRPNTIGTFIEFGK